MKKEIENEKRNWKELWINIKIEIRLFSMIEHGSSVGKQCKTASLKIGLHYAFQSERHWYRPDEQAQYNNSYSCIMQLANLRMIKMWYNVQYSSTR